MYVRMYIDFQVLMNVITGQHMYGINMWARGLSLHRKMTLTTPTIMSVQIAAICLVAPSPPTLSGAPQWLL